MLMLPFRLRFFARYAMMMPPFAITIARCRQLDTLPPMMLSFSMLFAVSPSRATAFFRLLLFFRLLRYAISLSPSSLFMLPPC